MYETVEKMSSENTKRVAKNSIFLYIRMILIMFVTLYTSRVILNTLGETDYGVYNVIAGMISMLTFLNSSITGATQRFLTFELGKSEEGDFCKVFGVALIIHVALAVIVVVLIELAGSWFLVNKLVIPSDRLSAARLVFHTATVVTALSIIQSPLNAAIIAHERMSFYAVSSVFEAFSKLGVACLLYNATCDKLVLYGSLILVVQTVLFVVYALYCRFGLENCKPRIVYDRHLFTSILSFSGWNLFGSMAWMLKGQGGNILLNMYGGPVVNAAAGISSQVTSAVRNLVSGFQTAVNPQITKNLASGNISFMIRMMNSSSKISYFLTLCIVLPLGIEADFVLQKWLVNVPDYSVLFLRISLAELLIHTLSGTLITGIMASGKIKSYQIFVGLIMMSSLLFSVFFLRDGFPICTVLVVSAAIMLFAHFTRLLFAHHILGMSIKVYFKDVLTPIMTVSITSMLIPLYIVHNCSESWFRLFFIIVASIVSLFISVLVFGLDKDEKRLIKSFVCNE